MFNRNKNIFSISYELYENEILLFCDVEQIKLDHFEKSIECYVWLKSNLYFFYKIIEIDIPFELIEFKFQKYLKNMGVDPYE